ncbi:hypothetical protein OIK44_07770 [Janthinobacterium sp. hw3]|uniref:Uncharacterized protein n=1 Tax=Janthinobacterium fluminis TaxID=2987524 RepID=A0ABT5JZ54_9BURK|nr:hypothetical protein [Janthinobacterium fluminis]
MSIIDSAPQYCIASFLNKDEVGKVSGQEEEFGMFLGLTGSASSCRKQWKATVAKPLVVPRQRLSITSRPRSN